MTHIANVKTPPAPTLGAAKRPYESRLRADQAEATRARVLEALVRTMASGVAGLSIPAVAREAGVSIPTVYRHFGSKQGLLDALNAWVVTRAGLVPAEMPETVEEMAPMVREVFGHLEAMDVTLRAALASELGREVRSAMMPQRLAMHRAVLERSAPDLPDDVLDRLASLSVILLSSAAYRAYKDYLHLGPDEAADLVAWALRTLVAGASTGGRTPADKRKEGGP
jgi:AcrR family transcriptional regulator